MSNLPRRFAAVAALACLLLASMGTGWPVAAARDVPITLYGSRSAGWGLTNSTLSSPGPHLTVEVGDNVTLNLTSVDGITHRWFIDYDNDSAADGTNPASPGYEPRSPNFGPDPVNDVILWNFTVSNLTGIFRYRSDRMAGPGDDLAMMWGNITIRNATSGGGLFGLDVVTLAVVGIALFIVAIAVMATFFRRRKREPPVPPPPED